VVLRCGERRKKWNEMDCNTKTVSSVTSAILLGKGSLSCIRIQWEVYSH
jgi:hypothetical protein